MKIIKLGSAQNLFWWVGAQLTCPYCGQVVQLEHGDECRINWLTAPSPRELRFSCSNCYEVIHLQRFQLRKVVEKAVPVCDCNAKSGGIPRIDCQVHGLKGVNSQGGK